MKPNRELIAKETYKMSKWRRILTYFVLLYCNFWMGMCYSLQAPFFPREAEEKGASATEYGWIIGAYSITSVFAGPLSAKLVLYIHPTILCYVAVFVYSWCTTLFGVLGWSSPGIQFIILSILCRILESLAYCVFFTSANSLLVDIFPKNRTVVVSIMETAYGVSMVLGPALGGPLYQLGGYFLPFGVSGFVILLGSVLCFVCLRSLDFEESQVSGNMSALILDYGFITCLFVAGNSFVGIGFNTATLEPHVRQFHLSASMVSIFFVAYSFMYTTSSVLWAWLCDKTGHEEPLIMSGIMLSLFGFVLIGPIPLLPFKETIYSIVIAQVLLGTGAACGLFCSFSHLMKDAMLNVTLNSHLKKAYLVAASCKRGFPDNFVTTTMVVGAVLSSASIGEFVGPVLGGFLLDHVGYHIATLCLTGVQGAIGVIFLSGIIWKKLSGAPKMSKEETLCLTSS